MTQLDGSLFISSLLANVSGAPIRASSPRESGVPCRQGAQVGSPETFAWEEGRGRGGDFREVFVTQGMERVAPLGRRCDRGVPANWNLLFTPRYTECVVPKLCGHLTL